MAINIKNVADFKDKGGLLGKGTLIASQLTKLYQVNSRSKYCQVNINVINPNAINANVKIWISNKNAPTHEDLYESRVVLEPDAVYARTNVILSANEILYFQSDIDDVVVRLDGFEDNPL